ncbi:MAG: Uma2 family endonuclease [Candidatus Velthaea sp.]|jgi:Uma2 family endonuclease
MIAVVHRFTTREYMKLHIEGRTELIEGIIYDVAARNDPHRLAVNRLSKQLQIALPQWQVQVQDAVAIPDWDGDNAPEPDIAVSKNEKNPSAVDTAAIIEVSDTTYDWDRRKVKLYTAAGINSWIVNIGQHRVEFFCAHQDAMHTAFHGGETFDILGVSIAVSSLFEVPA